MARTRRARVDEYAITLALFVSPVVIAAWIGPAADIERGVIAVVALAVVMVVAAVVGCSRSSDRQRRERCGRQA
jgi:hypothetical protein